MASGVQVADACKELYQSVKMNIQGKKKLKCGVFMISDNLKEIVIDGERTSHAEKQASEDGDGGPEHFMEIIRGLPKDDGRYVIYDYDYQSSFGKSSKLILLLWVPSGIPIKRKMLYASSKDALKKSFPDCGAEFQADCPDDICHSDIEAKLRKV